VDVDVLAVANGTVLNQTWPNQLIAYRLPTP
jgi:hypothetical protein